MTFLVFKEQRKKAGDAEMAGQCTSAIFNYQVIGSGAVVEFSGSNKPDADPAVDQHWEPAACLGQDPLQGHCGRGCRNLCFQRRQRVGRVFGNIGHLSKGSL